jgi:hypothetical protein
LHSDAGAITAKAWLTLFRSTFLGSIRRRLDSLLVLIDCNDELNLYLIGIRVSRRGRSMTYG